MSNNENEVISFETFIKVIDFFTNNKTEKQYKFMFELFDFDKDGKNANEDILINFKLLLGNSLNKEQIINIDRQFFIKNIFNDERRNNINNNIASIKYNNLERTMK